MAMLVPVFRERDLTPQDLGLIGRPSRRNALTLLRVVSFTSLKRSLSRAIYDAVSSLDSRGGEVAKKSVLATEAVDYVHDNSRTVPGYRMGSLLGSVTWQRWPISALAAMAPSAMRGDRPVAMSWSRTCLSDNG